MASFAACYPAQDPDNSFFHSSSAVDAWQDGAKTLFRNAFATDLDGDDGDGGDYHPIRHYMSEITAKAKLTLRQGYKRLQ